MFIVDAGVCIGTTSIAGGRLTSDEVFRFTLAAAARRAPYLPAVGPSEMRTSKTGFGAKSTGETALPFLGTACTMPTLRTSARPTCAQQLLLGSTPVLLTVGTRSARLQICGHRKPMLPNDDG